MSLSETDFVPSDFGPGEFEQEFRAWTECAKPHETALFNAEDAFARGLEEGQQLARAAFEPERQALVKLLGSAEALQPLESEAVNRLILESVERLVTEIVGSAPVDKQWLLEQIQRITAAAASINTQQILRLHPDDFALLEGLKCDATMLPDASLERGTLRLELDNSCLEHGRAVMLDALRFRTSDTGLAS